MYRRDARGFTLLEVLIVVGILALLAALVMPRLFGAGEAAKIDMVRAQIGPTGPIGMAMDIYQHALGKYPDTTDGLRALNEAPSDEEDELKWRNTGGPFLRNPEALMDPWGQEYQYTFPGEKNQEDQYDLWSYGPDGEDGTDDDIVNWLKDDDPRNRLVGNR